MGALVHKIYLGYCIFFLLIFIVFFILQTPKE